MGIAPDARLSAASSQKSGFIQGSLIVLFVCSLFIPINMFLGPIRLSPYRFLAAVTFVPLFFMWLSGRFGPIYKADVMMVCFGVWSALGLLITTPAIADAIEPAGSLMVDAVGCYLLGRCAIRREADFRLLLRAFLFMLLVLLPFAFIENLTGHPLLLEAVRSLGFPVGIVVMDPRFGLERAQVTFEHPILFGTVAAAMFGLFFISFAAGRSIFVKMSIASISFFAAIASVSTGALASLVVQFIFIFWRWGTARVFPIHRPWRAFSILAVLGYVVIDMISIKTPFHVIVNYLTFSSGSAYGRILIFNFGIEEVWRHPIFGIGLSDWVRPAWMSASMDNFWLYTAVTAGLPAFFFMVGAFYLMLRRLAGLNRLSPALCEIRAGLLVSFGGLIIAAGTVHLWNAAFAFTMFLLGASAWLIEADAAGAESDQEA